MTKRGGPPRAIGELTGGIMDAIRRARAAVGDAEPGAWERDQAERQRAERDRFTAIQEQCLPSRQLAAAKAIMRGEGRRSSSMTRLFRVLRDTPDASVILCGPFGCGKTTAVTAYALQRIADGWTVRHVQAGLFAGKAKSEVALEELQGVDLLIMDQLHQRPPDWVWDAMFGVLNARYEAKRQTIGIVSEIEPKDALEADWLERFVKIIPSSEASWREETARSTDEGDLSKGKSR